jgi:hypothetical protein
MYQQVIHALGHMLEIWAMRFAELELRYGMRKCAPGYW